jgi:hypothetical protein
LLQCGLTTDNNPRNSLVSAREAVEGNSTNSYVVVIHIFLISLLQLKNTL